ncbi:hypothetical protein BGW39_006019 [Mortierella sp. 14UC]|nr:hypothetical protein BGW39_006019 [Mortierella sp. 14UC]
MVNMMGLNKRAITYLAITVIAVLLSLQLYASHLGKKATVIPSLTPATATQDPSIVTPPSPFQDIEAYCAKVPAPRHPRGLFLSDRTQKDGPIKIFFWKQISWSNLETIKWREETEKLCPISPELQAFFDYFKQRIVDVREKSLVWPLGFAPCFLSTTTFYDYLVGPMTGTCNTPAKGDIDYVFTTNYTEFASADIVLMNYPFLFSNWEYPYFDTRFMPPRIAHQKWILHFYDESIGYYPHIAYPPFLRQFDLTIGSPPSLMDIPHATYPITEAKALELTNAEPAFPLDRTAEHYIAFMVSNCESKNHREDLMDKLIKDAGAHSYGKCRQNRDVPKELEAERWDILKTKTLAPYPFGLAAENSNCMGYVTEKFYDVLASGAIPVYFGASDIADFVPEGSYIDVSAFKNYDDLIHHIKTVDRAPFYKWKEIVKKDLSKFCKRCFAPSQPVSCSIVNSINFV